MFSKKLGNLDFLLNSLRIYYNQEIITLEIHCWCLIPQVCESDNKDRNLLSL